MNRSIQAFAVLLVSLAGGMLAATWTSTLPLSRHAALATSRAPEAFRGMHCSCNPESLVRFEKGCARDKTTGELYGCGLGLGNNGTGGKSVITHTANAAVASIIENAKAVGEIIDGLSFQEWPAWGKKLAAQLASMKTLPEQEIPKDRGTEQDYAAAELAAAGFDPKKIPSAKYLEPIRRLPSLFSAESVSAASKHIVSQLGGLSRTCDRQTRLWLVEAGLHRHWDAAEAMQQEQRLAGIRLQLEDENIDRRFENFPRPVSEQDRLLNPDAPAADFSEDSRRTILAAAKMLDSLASLLHQTAENLARHAEQDVAELHKLKSGIEEHR